MLCEIIKPTKFATCSGILEKNVSNNKTIKSACKSYLDKKRKSTPSFHPTSMPDIAKKYFDWKNIDKMIDDGTNITHILKNIQDKIDQLMNNNGTVVDLMNTVSKLRRRKMPMEDFQKNKKDITNRYTNIFSSILNTKYRSAWTKISYKERKNASMEIIIQLNELVKDNYCSLQKGESFDLNPNSQSKNKNVLSTENIFLEAFNLNGNATLNDRFLFPNNLNSNLGDLFGNNLIYFPNGLNFTEIDLDNPVIECSSMNGIDRNFATGVIYKNLAEYLHNNRSNNALAYETIKKSPSNEITSFSSMEDEFEFNEGENVNSTDYSIRPEDGIFDDNDESLKNFDNHVLNSQLVGFTFNNIMKKSIKLNKPARIIIEHLNLKERLDQLKCVFFNFTTEEWSDSGCRLVENNRLFSVCECDHLTNFALLMDISGREQENNSIKSALTLLCVILSIIGLLITIIVFTFIPKLKSKRNLITANLCFNLLIVNILVGFFLEIKNEVNTLTFMLKNI